MKSEFIKTLREEHIEIHDIFCLIDAENDLVNKKILFRKMLDIAIPHLKKEDEELYPKLEQSSDEEVRNMARVFSASMKEYSSELINNVEKIIESEENITPSLYEDYEESRIKIEGRISIEEVTIFPAYEKMV